MSTAELSLSLATALLLAATALSFLRVAHGFVRVFSFPRLQMVAVALLLMVAEFFLLDPSWTSRFITLGLIVVLVAQIVPIVQFTPLRRRQSLDYDGDPHGPNTLSILSFNVKQSNRDYAAALQVARQADADIAIFMETDADWLSGLAPLDQTYEHKVAHPLGNAYGMVLFSRLELADAQVRYLMMEEIPSITATLTLRDGQRFRLYCVHPEPPVPVVDSIGRDAELVTVAGLVANETLPAIVTGDLNDVAWSHTTRLFQRLSGLLDPRIGRGFYSTFDARFFFMRWPLDHLFHDARFRLISIRRLPRAGSDHFPILFRLALTASAGGAPGPEAADAEDKAEASELKREGRQLDRDPIGVDWED